MEYEGKMKVMRQEWKNETDELQDRMNQQRDKFKVSASQVEEKVKLVLAKKKSIIDNLIAENAELKSVIEE